MYIKMFLDYSHSCICITILYCTKVDRITLLLGAIVLIGMKYEL